MSNTDVAAAVLQALKTRWAYQDYYNIGGNHARGFDVSRLNVRFSAFNYGDFDQYCSREITVLKSDTFLNDDEHTIIKKTFTYSVEKEDTYEWHVDAGITLGTKASAKVGLPIIGEGEVEASVEVNVEGGAKTTTSSRVTWSDETEVEVPPLTRVEVKGELKQGTFKNVPFEAVAEVYGQVGAEIVAGVNESGTIWRWMWGDIETGSGWYTAGLSPLKQPPVDPVALRYKITGTISAAVGFHSITSVVPIKGPTS